MWQNIVKSLQGKYFAPTCGMERHKQSHWHLSALQGTHVEVEQPNPSALLQMQEQSFAVLAAFPSS